MLDTIRSPANTPYRYFGLASQIYRPLRRLSRRVRYIGGKVYCAVCDRTYSRWRGEQDIGPCPVCDSSARQQVIAMHVSRANRDRSLAGKRILYFAPDSGLRRFLGKLGAKVTTTDLGAPDVDVQASVTALPFPDGSYDLIVISHVLEHVPEDGAAMAELRRVLAPGGEMLVQVPFGDTPRTDEDPEVVDPDVRSARWGQFDHVRLYGWDIVDRFVAAGLEVRSERPAAEMSDRERRRLGLWNDILFICRRPALNA